VRASISASPARKYEPQASHLDLLSAFLPAEQIRAAYEEAIARKYLWHEFGDLNLIL
jgi:S-adenosylmethionine:tRNA ribosyltransferase-isomerase